MKTLFLAMAVASLAPTVAHAQDSAADYPRKTVRIIVPAAPGGLDASSEQGSRLRDASVRESAAAAWMIAQASIPQEQYPTRPVRVIVPAAPGGGADIVARLIGQQLGKSLGQTFLTDNRPGAANIVGTEIVAKAQPDGYTLIVNTAGPMSINPLIYIKLPYDALKDFAPITNVADTALVLVVHPTVPAKSVAELIAYAKTKPGQLAYASWGRGSANHLATELFMMMTQVKLLQVPYKGSGAAMPEVLAGNVQMTFDTIASAVPQIRAGRLRPLGVSALKRSGAIPEVPTIAEAGLDGYEAGSWFGFLAPARTPREIVTKLHGEIVKAMKLPEVQERLATLGLDPVGNTPAQFGEQIRSDLAKWRKVVQAAGIQPE